MSTKQTKRMDAKKKRKPQDATLRNVKAANKRLKRIEQWLEFLTLDVNNLNDAMLEVHPNFYLNKDHSGLIRPVRKLLAGRS